MSTKIKLLIGIVIAGAIVFFAYPRVASFLAKKRMLDPGKTDEVVLEQNTKALDTFLTQTSAENQRAYIEKVDQDLLNTRLGNDAKNALLLRKALAISVMRGEIPGASITEALDIYRKLILSTEATPSALYLKDFSIIAFVRLYPQLDRTDSKILDTPDTLLDYSLSKRLGYSDGLSTLLALNDVTKKISPIRSDDLITRAESMFLSAVILNTYDTELKQTTRDTLMEDLGVNIQSFKQFRPLTFPDPILTRVESSFKYAFAYDIYESHRNTVLSSDTNKAIDDNYGQAQRMIDGALPERDTVSINEMNFYKNILNLESLHRRYGDAVDKNRQDALIKDTLSIIHSSKELEGLSVRVLKSGMLFPMFPVNHFISLSKANQDIADYLTSIGIQP